MFTYLSHGQFDSFSFTVQIQINANSSQTWPHCSDWLIVRGRGNKLSNFWFCSLSSFHCFHRLSELFSLLDVLVLQALCLFLSLHAPVVFPQVFMPFASLSLDETHSGVFCPFTSSYPPFLSGWGSSNLALLRRTTIVSRKQSSPPHTKTTCRPRNLQHDAQRLLHSASFGGREARCSRKTQNVPGSICYIHMSEFDSFLSCPLDIHINSYVTVSDDWSEMAQLYAILCLQVNLHNSCVSCRVGSIFTASIYLLRAQRESSWDHIFLAISTHLFSLHIWVRLMCWHMPRLTDLWG